MQVLIGIKYNLIMAAHNDKLSIYHFKILFLIYFFLEYLTLNVNYTKRNNLFSK